MRSRPHLDWQRAAGWTARQLTGGAAAQSAQAAQSLCPGQCPRRDDRSGPDGGTGRPDAHGRARLHPLCGRQRRQQPDVLCQLHRPQQSRGRELLQFRLRPPDRHVSELRRSEQSQSLPRQAVPGGRQGRHDRRQLHPVHRRREVQDRGRALGRRRRHLDQDHSAPEPGLPAQPRHVDHHRPAERHRLRRVAALLSGVAADGDVAVVRPRPYLPSRNAHLGMVAGALARPDRRAAQGREAAAVRPVQRNTPRRRSVAVDRTIAGLPDPRRRRRQRSVALVRGLAGTGPGRHQSAARLAGVRVSGPGTAARA